MEAIGAPADSGLCRGLLPGFCNRFFRNTSQSFCLYLKTDLSSSHQELSESYFVFRKLHLEGPQMVILSKIFRKKSESPCQKFNQTSWIGGALTGWSWYSFGNGPRLIYCIFGLFLAYMIMRYGRPWSDGRHFRTNVQDSSEHLVMLQQGGFWQ